MEQNSPTEEVFVGARHAVPGTILGNHAPFTSGLSAPPSFSVAALARRLPRRS
jgi:hypothetical protein